MAAISLLNPKAEVARAAAALAVNISAAKGIQDVMRTNLGPKGTVKMLVSGAASDSFILIARASTAQDDMTGDGTTSTVLIIGELLKQADIYIADGLHPRLLAEGFDKARAKTLEILEKIKIPIEVNKENLTDIARTSLKTKVHPNLADVLTDICVDAVLAIKQENKPVDLHMVEIMEMQHKTDIDTQLIKGLVLDHGARHPDMPKRVTNAYILTCNVSMEYEKSEVNSGFFYKTAEEREKLVQAEREFIDQRVKKVIELKRKLCNGTNKNFVVLNQKGIDPMSLDMLAKEGIIALRRAKRRNMERLALACGGIALNHLDDIQESQLGFAGLVYEHVLGENKYTFVEECKVPLSVTILIKGPNKHTLTQIKDAVRDGLRAINNAIEDKALIPGAGAFELTAYNELMAFKDTVKGKSRLGTGAGAFELTAYNELMAFKDTVKGKSRLGVAAYAEALLVIPKVLATNSGFDAQDTLVKLQEESRLNPEPIGLDLTSGEAINPKEAGIFDNYIVKKQIINSCSVIASNLLLVDEIMRAGMSSLKG
ncbi:TCP-1/cpn60 chaperonin family [Popillia japonica]|uniref:TCP-1/cpn60 chaperonin family n=1 Tax=Popillia japonica TaxID=7064 RepID=A0AAW1KM61_POPJA